MKDGLKLFIPITKVDAEKRLVYGIISEEIEDKSGEILDYASSKPAFEEWSNSFKEASGGKSLGNVRAMHGNIAAGKLTEINFDDDNKRVEGCAKVIDDTEWQKVLEGVYTGFSIGGGYAKRWADPLQPGLMRYTPTLSEVSLVDNPCVPTATFEVIKADGSSEMRKFITPSKHEETMTINANAGGAASIANTELVKDGKAVKPKSAPVQKWEASDGKTFLNKRDCEIHEITIEKQAELAPAVAEMDELLKGAKKPDAKADDEKSGDGKDKGKGDENAADDKGKAKADDAKKDDADAAAGDEKAKEDKSADKKKSKKADGANGLAKSLYGIGELAYILSSINSFMSCAQYERAVEGDESAIPEAIKAWLKTGSEILKAYVEEETGELFTGDDVEESEVGDILEMAAKMTGEQCDALAKLFKSEKVKAALGKAGARHSKADTEALLSLHKGASDHVAEMEKCFKGMGIMEDDSDDEAKKSAGNIKLNKAISELQSRTDEVLAVTKVAAQANDTLLKALPIMKSLQETVEKQNLRIEHLEKQPMPFKGNARVFEKSHDGGTGDGKNLIEKTQAELEKMSPDERARALMKLALSNPAEGSPARN